MQLFGTLGPKQSHTQAYMWLDYSIKPQPPVIKQNLKIKATKYQTSKSPQQFLFRERPVAALPLRCQYKASWFSCIKMNLDKNVF